MIRTAIIVIVSFFVSTPLAGVCAETELKTVAVPVFFATDRPLDVQSAANIRYTDQQLPEPQLNYGVKNIVVTGAGIPDGSSERTLGLGWWTPIGTGNKTAPLRNVTLTRDELFSQLKEIVNSGPLKRPLIVFLNGCCQPFDTAANYAATLSRYSESPMLLYAWAALPPTTQKYRENEQRERQGERRFHEFLSALEKEIPPERLVLVGYSMGNRLLFHGLRQRFFEHGSNPNYPKLRGVVFGCADVNVDDFASDQNYITFNSKQTWVTKNDLDKALNMSQLQRGLYGRLGAPKSATNRLLQSTTLDILDIRPLMGISHDFPYAYLTDVIRNEEGGILPRFRVSQLKPHLFKVEKL